MRAPHEQPHWVRFNVNDHLHYLLTKIEMKQRKSGSRPTRGLHQPMVGEIMGSSFLTLNVEDERKWSHALQSSSHELRSKECSSCRAPRKENKKVTFL